MVSVMWRPDSLGVLAANTPAASSQQPAASQHTQQHNNNNNAAQHDCCCCADGDESSRLRSRMGQGGRARPGLRSGGGPRGLTGRIWR